MRRDLNLGEEESAEEALEKMHQEELEKLDEQQKLLEEEEQDRKQAVKYA